MTLGVPPAELELYLESELAAMALRELERLRALEGRRWWLESSAGWLVGRSDLAGAVTVAELGTGEPRKPAPAPYVDAQGRSWDGSSSGGIGVRDVGRWIEYLELDRRIHDAAARVRARARRAPRRRRSRAVQGELEL